MKGLRFAWIWAKKQIKKKRTLKKMRKLCRRAVKFKVAYRFPQDRRTITGCQVVRVTE